MKPSSTKIPNGVARVALFVLLFPFVCLKMEAEIWIGMQKGELLKELGAPVSSLAAGPKELHYFSDGRSVEILNDRVVGAYGFPVESIIEVKEPADEESAKASTAYASASATTKVSTAHVSASAGAPAKKTPEFVDFKVLEETPKETFTLSNSSESPIAVNWLKDFLESDNASTFYIIGGGLAACFLAAMIISFSRSREAVSSEESPTRKIDHELPPFLQSAPAEKPSLSDPRGDMSEMREERLAQREDPDSLGLSIRATPYQDFDSTLPRGPLVSNANAAGGNLAYSSKNNTATASSKPTRKKRGTAPKISKPAAKRSSSLKLESK